MKEVSLNKTKEFIIGAVRLSKEVFDKVQKLAKDNKVSPQTIVRAILENFIDDIKFK